MKKLDPKTILILFMFGSILSVLVGWVGGTMYAHIGGQPDFRIAISTLWLTFVGLPGLWVSRERLLYALGQRPQPRITTTPGPEREIQVNGVGGPRSIFMTVLHPFAPPAAESAPAAPVSYTVTIDATPYTITTAEVDRFLNVAWSRQQRNQAPFSRHYWTRKRRPALSRELYEAHMRLVEQAGAVIDRGERRSGRMAIAPGRAMAQLQERV